MSSQNTSLSDSEDAENSLRKSYKRLKRDYKELETRVVALTQREYQVTDEKITKKYQQIRDGIDIWIDELRDEERRDFCVNYRRQLGSQHREKVFAALGFRAGCLDERWEEKLGRLETCIYVILGLVISNGLKRILGQDYPLGLTNTQLSFLKQMQTSSQSNDQAMFYRWRGETLSTIAVTPEFTKRQKEYSDEVFGKMKADISPWLGSKSTDKHEAALRGLVLQPAVDFHRMINCSGKKFELLWYNAVENPVSKMAMDWNLIDTASWRVSRHSDIKGIFGCLLPGLIMRVAIDQSDVTFANPVLLGYKSSSLNPNKSARSSPIRPQEAVSKDTTSELGHRSPQSHGSRAMTSKGHRSGSIVERSSWSMMRLLGNRSEGGASRKSSSTATSPLPHDQRGRQEFTRPFRTASTFPQHQTPQSDLGEAGSWERCFSTSARIPLVDRDDDQDPLSPSLSTDGQDGTSSDSSLENQNGSHAGTVNVRAERSSLGYLSQEEARRRAHLPEHNEPLQYDYVRKIIRQV